MHYALFEDNFSQQLLPLAWNNPVFDLRCGIFTARERAERLIGTAPAGIYVRSFLADVMAERTGLPVNETTLQVRLLINGRLLLTPQLVQELSVSSETPVVFRAGDIIAAVSLPEGQDIASAVSWVSGSGPDAPLVGAETVEVECAFVEYPWHLIAYNESMLLQDAEEFELGIVDADKLSESAEYIQTGNLYIGAGAEIGAGVIIDASKGPVVIDEGAVVMHQAIIVGPAYIGKKSRIKIGAKIYENTSIGPVCKAGGEIEGSILAAYANKQHDGFLGHSYLAPWTNLGADTNTSDLKNNYSPVSMTLEGIDHKTGMQFLGLILADHSKSGINTMFNTGTCTGVGGNVYGGGFPPKFIPAFSWGGAEGFVEYKLDKFLETARIVMERRNMQLSEAERVLLRYIYEQTASQRSQYR